MRVTVIVNPKAGRRRALRAAEEVAALLRGAGWDTDILHTKESGHATTLAREAATQSDLILACGGDGTLSEVVNGLLETDIPAGLIPAGTGNDFARTIGMSPQPAQAAQQILGGGPVPVDLLEVGETGIVALNIIGAGFDAAVARRMNAQTRNAGFLAYLSAVLLELADLRPTELRLRIDGAEWQGRALLVAVANAQSYGAGMRIAPQASITDGLLDVVLVREMSRLHFLRSLPLVFRGAHLSHSHVQVWQGREVHIETAEPAPVLVDGDLRAHTPLTVRVLPGRARLWLPSSPACPASCSTSDSGP